jgi:hypothetical protein
VWVPEPDLKTAASAWIYAGAAHHTGFSMGILRWAGCRRECTNGGGTAQAVVIRAGSGAGRRLCAGLETRAGGRARA